MERRTFIKQSAAAIGALSLPNFGNAILVETYSSVSGTVTGQTSRFKKSIMWATVGKGPVADKCKAIKAAGFSAIEPSGGMDTKEVLDAVRANGLAISSVCSTSPGGRPLSNPDAATRQQALESIIHSLEEAKVYGTDAVLVIPGAVSESISYDDCWKLSVEGLKKARPTAEKLKVNICVENVWNNFLLSPMEAVNYVDQFNSPFVKFYFDCGNICNYGWPEQWIRILGNRISRIHIKEYNKQKADKQGRIEGFNVKLTEGDIDWAKVMAAIRKSYQSELLISEQSTAGTVEDMTDLCQRFDKILSL
jgi:hexulose-6-phosphate isomerase